MPDVLPRDIAGIAKEKESPMSILIVLLVCAAIGCAAIASAGGLSGVARHRKYKSGSTWAFFRWTDVDSEYILRLHIFKTPWCAVCLHWIRKPDAEPWLHDHPVTFLSVILRGKYAELRQRMGDTGPYFEVHRWFNWISADQNDRHRIVFTRKNTLTLCFMGPKTREWGFHTRDGWTYWKDYYAKKRKEDEIDAERISWPVFFKGLDEKVDKLTERFIASNDGKIFCDEEVRRVSTVEGDFDDEAPTEPKR